MKFIGDVHGKIDQYLKLIGTEPTFQLGDMGLGFDGVKLPRLKARHKFIRGNHDNPSICKEHPNYVGEFGYKNGLFFMSGAYSIDVNYRQAYEMMHGKKIWWRDEELWEPELNEARDLFVKSRPEIVATHDCPMTVTEKLLGELEIGFRPEKLVKTRTGRALQRMFSEWQPKVWLFGHYHIDKDFMLDGTRFICLNELSVIDIPVGSHDKGKKEQIS